MPLVLTLKKGETFSVAGVSFTVENVVPDSFFTLRRGDFRCFDVGFSWSYISNGVRVRRGSSKAGHSSCVSVVIDAPLWMQILRSGYSKDASVASVSCSS